MWNVKYHLQPSTSLYLHYFRRRRNVQNWYNRNKHLNEEALTQKKPTENSPHDIYHLFFGGDIFTSPQTMITMDTTFLLDQEVLSQRQAALSSCEEMVANSEVRGAPRVGRWWVHVTRNQKWVFWQVTWKLIGDKKVTVLESPGVIILIYVCIDRGWQILPTLYEDCIRNISLRGVMKWDPFWGNPIWCKCMEHLRNLSLLSALFGLVV